MLIKRCGLIILEQRTATGGISLLNRAQQGFSYIELLVSLLIISFGVVGYTELISRVKSTQHHANEQLQAILLADYIEENNKINNSLCFKTVNFNKSVTFAP